MPAATGLRRFLFCCLLFHLNLALKDRTPLLVVRHRHATFDADLDALLWRFALSQQSIQKRHETSVFVDTFDGRKRFTVGAAKGADPTLWGVWPV
jgi:hypothetical protein